MSDSTRLAVTAATIVVVAVGGLYLVGLIGPGGSGGPRPTATPIPTPSQGQSIIDIGTITLDADGCTWDGNPGSIDASPDRLPVTVNVRNETDTFANFGVYLLDEGYLWEDAEAWIIRENEALHGGPSQPPNDFVTDVGSIDAPDRGQEPPANLTLGPGVHGIVCSSNEPPPGEIFAVYVVGPLEITEP